MHRASRLKAIAARASVILCALLVVSSMAQAAELAIENVVVDYITQTASTATGTVTFDVTLASLGGDPGNYDRASVQVLISQTLKGGGGDVFSLSSATDDTAAIGQDYWLYIFGLPTGNELSYQTGNQFYFGDFISPGDGRTPSPADVIARFVLDFEADAPSGFGTYNIESGDADENEFGADLFFSYSNAITPNSFRIERLPEPSTAILFAVGFGSMLLLRRP